MLDNETGKAQKTKIGIIVGGGTGKHIADLIEKFFHRYIDQERYEIIRSDNDEDYYHFYSYADIKRNIKTKLPENQDSWSKKISENEAETIFKLYQKWKNQGVDVIVRTSINAESLYELRQKGKALKEINIVTQNGNRILVIRDQAEGYYANVERTYSPEKITFSGQFTQKHTKILAQFALNRAKSEFKGTKFGRWVLYKAHLFGDRLERWFKEVDDKFKVFQPDTGYTELFNSFLVKDSLVYNQVNPDEKKNLLLVCSNEIGDLVYEPLIEYLNIHQSKVNLFSRNHYLADSIKGLVEYQTVHGSADDCIIKGGQGEEVSVFLPFATMRIAADIAESRLGLSGAIKEIDKGIALTEAELFDHVQNKNPAELYDSGIRTYEVFAKICENADIANMNLIE